MRKPPSRPAATSRKRAPHQPAQFRDWTIVESTLTPMLTPEQIAAELAPEQARAPRAPRRTHRAARARRSAARWVTAITRPATRWCRRCACAGAGWNSWVSPSAARCASRCAPANWWCAWPTRTDAAGRQRVLPGARRTCRACRRTPPSPRRRGGGRGTAPGRARTDGSAFVSYAIPIPDSNLAPESAVMRIAGPFVSTAHRSSRDAGDVLP